MRRLIVFVLIILLFGALVAPAAAQPPTTTEDLLAGMVTEEVEPGVYRVVNDGVRDLTTPSGPIAGWYAGATADYIYPGRRAVIVGSDGSVWRTAGCVSPSRERKCMRLFRVGREEAWDVEPVPVSFWDNQVDAGPDGRLWALAEDGPRVFDDGAWQPDVHGVQGDFNALVVDDGGTVWLVGEDLCWTGETSAGCTDWTDVHDGDVHLPFVATGEGAAWFMTEPAGDGAVSFLRFDGSDWQAIPAPADYPGDPTTTTHPIGMTGDGGTWWTAGDRYMQHDSLTRLDDQGWTTFTVADGVGTWGGQQGEWSFPTDMLKVAPDGSAWVNVAELPTSTRAGVPRTCGGVARFDGNEWRSFLAGRCISDLDFAPDSSVWLAALDRTEREVSTYVITPEAVAVTE